ncbi:MAG: acetoacetate--CoA ligase [Chloroflexi bacterium]|nr:acetoacetate--CoA ligase [Chloroflexota bacterium]
MRLAEGTLLWAPTADDIAATNLTAYLGWLQRERGRTFGDYAALWRWSVNDLAGFWSSIVDYFDLPLHGDRVPVLDDAPMPGTRWYEGAEINYAEAVFRRAAPDRPALIFQSERDPQRSVSWTELETSVAAVAAGLRRSGVGRGDRVVAVMPNIPETVVAFLACASLGAIWASCSPDFGTRSLIDRFAQISPKVLFAVDGYTYGGKAFDRRAVIAEIQAAMPGLERTVVLPHLDPAATADGPLEMTWADLTSGPAEPLTFDSVPFDHPLWVVYSSGTTGLPKAIVHGHGGIVLEHAKVMGLHCDVRPGDRMFWFTTTGWMMWNLLLGSLLVGGTAVLYDGNPGHPDLGTLWQMAAEGRITQFGTSAAFISASLKAGVRPGAGHDLTALRSVGSTGSPLSVEGFGWVYEAIKPDVWLFSFSGGTDVASAFVGGVPTLAVHAGELQAPFLGARVEAFDEAGRSVVGQTGELVLTAPLPSMPIFFWNDPDGERLRTTYFEMYPGVWRHGDWIRFTERAGAVIEGRSDSTLNRHGIRFGTSELYGVVEALPDVRDSLVIGLELPGGRYWMPLFVVLADGVSLNDDVERRIKLAIRESLSARHLPEAIVVVPAIPRTLTGKKMEVPVKRLLLGRPLDEVAVAGAVADPDALAFFADYARVVEGLSG